MKTVSIALTALAVGVTVGAGALVTTQVQSRQALPVTTETAPKAGAFSRRAPAGGLRLMGEIDGPSAGGTVTVRANGRVVGQGPVSATNTWSIDIAAIGASEMITAEWQAPSIHFTATVGGFNGLRTRAGTDAVLTVAESDTLRISALSTTTDLLTARSIGGAARSDTQYETALRTMDSADLHAVAFGLQHVAADPSALPAGYPDGLALARSEGGFALLAQTTLGVESGPVFRGWRANPMADSALDNGLVLLRELADPDRPLSMPYAEVLERSGPAYRIYTPNTTHPVHSGRTVDGKFVLTPESPRRSVIYRDRLCPSDMRAYQPIVTELVEFRYDRLRRGQRVDLWRSTYVERTTWPECPDFAGMEDIHLSSGMFRGISLTQTMPMPGGRRPFAGVKSLPAFCKEASPDGLGQALQMCDYAPHRFDANGQGMQRELGPKVAFDTMAPIAATGERPFTWVRPTQGTLHVDTADASTRYWLIDLGEPGVTGWAYAATGEVDGTLQGAGGYTAMLSSVVESPAISIVGTWTHSDEALYAMSVTYPQTPDPRTWRSIFSADGKLLREPGIRARWSATPGRIYDTRVFANGSTPSAYYDCDEAAAAGATACTPSFVRAFRPMLVQGDWVYGIQDSYQNPVPPGYGFPIESYRTSTRPVAYRRESMRR